MFGKLMKYECKSYLKIVLPLWIAIILMGLLNGVSLKMFDDEKVRLKLLFVILPLFLYVTSFVATAVVSYILVLKRFWNGLLGREGYLMFTLPVSRDQLILSKLLGAVAVNLLSTLAGIVAVSLTVWLIGGTDAVTFLPQALQRVAENMELSRNQQFVVIVQAFFLCIFASAASVLKLYAAMAVGHLAKKNRVICSVGAYIGFGIVIRILMIIFSSFGAVNRVMESLLSGYTDMFSSGFDFSTTALGVSILASVISILVYGFLTHLVIRNRLNLE